MCFEFVWNRNIVRKLTLRGDRVMATQESRRVANADVMPRAHGRLSLTAGIRLSTEPSASEFKGDGVARPQAMEKGFALFG